MNAAEFVICPPYPYPSNPPIFWLFFVVVCGFPKTSIVCRFVQESSIFPRFSPMNPPIFPIPATFKLFRLALLAMILPLALFRPEKPPIYKRSVPDTKNFSHVTAQFVIAPWFKASSPPTVAPFWEFSATISSSTKSMFRSSAPICGWLSCFLRKAANPPTFVNSSAWMRWTDISFLSAMPSNCATWIANPAALPPTPCAAIPFAKEILLLCPFTKW